MYYRYNVQDFAFFRNLREQMTKEKKHINGTGS